MVKKLVNVWRGIPLLLRTLVTLAFVLALCASAALVYIILNPVKPSSPSNPSQTEQEQSPPEDSVNLASPSAALAPVGYAPNDPHSVLPGTLLIADRGNNRIIEVNADKQIVWQYPDPTTPTADLLHGPDDAFLTPDKKHVITNEEDNQTIKIIDYQTKQVVWRFGHPGQKGSGPGYANTPDDAYQLPNGLVSVADIRNCRVDLINPDGSYAKLLGQTGYCHHNPPKSFGSPNGDTPLADGGMLVSEINGNYITRLDAAGNVVFSVQAPLHYVSDAQLTQDGNILVVDYHVPGKVIKMTSTGQVLWSYGPASGPGELADPSLAIELPNGLIALNDDANDRVLIIDPKTNAIVWVYGHNRIAGSNLDYLYYPDGINFIPAGTH